MSDQDFFFDEDEAPAEKPKPAQKSASATRKSEPAARPAKSAAATPAGTQTVTMTVAGLIGVVALLVGIIIGILIPTGGTQPTTPAGVPAPGGTQARPLSPDELGGDLPPGHPDIGGMTGGAPSETTTPTPESGEDAE